MASGLILGPRSTPAPVVADEPPGDPRDVLEELLLPALRRRPCLVAFSGGRDSSAILAVATNVARRHGLPDPVPLTLRFPDHPRTEETEWQEAVIRHLGLDDWETAIIDTDLEILGDRAKHLLTRHGLFWPSNATTMDLLAQRGAGGAILTGNGGDEIFSPWSRRRIALIRRGALRPERGETKHVLASFLPFAVRRRIWRRRPPIRLSWLTEEGDEQLSEVVGDWCATQYRDWGGQTHGLLNGRFRELIKAATDAFAADADTFMLEPFFEPRFVKAVVAAAPADGFEDRTATLERFFGDLLPRATIARSTKAAFTEVFFGPGARAFAERWDGSGLPRDLVDVDELRAMWVRERRDMRSFTPLQAAWLASAAQDTEAVASSTRSTTS
jgi:asparagine synthase (glutamine-hydrolysing)